MFPSRVQTVYQLLVVDRQTRVTYAQSILNLYDEEDILALQIIMSDEAQFYRCRHHFVGFLEVTSLCQQASCS